MTATGNPCPQRLPVDRQWLRKLVQKHETATATATATVHDHPPTSTEENPSHDTSPTPIFILAPMVDQSDLPFRLLCRKYGCQVAFTPMIHSRLLIESADYRSKFLPRALPHAQDRPLIAQLCGSGLTPQYVLQAAQLLQDTGLVDAIDLNCGCPQNIAKRGKYGAFLLEQPDALVEVVKLLTKHLTIPVSVKVRLLPKVKSRVRQKHAEPEDSDDTGSEEPAPPETVTTAVEGHDNDEDDAPQTDLSASLALYRRLVLEGGIHMLTVHGRTRHHKGHHVGPCNMQAIRTVVEELGHMIPIVANGSVASRQDAIDILKSTGCDAVMSSEAILEYPALFEAPKQVNQPMDDPPALGGHRRSRVQLAREYLQLCETFPPQVGGQGSGIKCIRMHMHRILHEDLQTHFDIRDRLCRAKSLRELHGTLDALALRHNEQNHQVESETLSWYYRHQKLVDAPNYDENQSGNLQIHRRDRESAVRKVELAEDTGDCFVSLFDKQEADEYDY